MQQYARKLGYRYNMRVARRRVSWRRDATGAPLYRQSSASEIVHLRDQMITAGEITLGRDICPMSHTSLRRAEVTTTTPYGKMISLDDIRLLHLREMSENGVIRRTNITQLDATQCREILTKYEGEHACFDFPVLVNLVTANLSKTYCMMQEQCQNFTEFALITNHKQYYLYMFLMS